MFGLMFGFYIGTQSFFTFPKESIGNRIGNCISQRNPLGKGFAILFPEEIIGKVVSVGVPVRASGSLDDVALPEESIGNYRKMHSSQK